MLTGTLLSQALGVFGTGVLASLSPCVYPMLPITLGFLSSQTGNQGKRSVVLSYVLGQTLALIAIGMLAVKLGETLGFSSESPLVSLLVGVLLILAGVFSWFGRLPAFMNRWNSVSDRLSPKKKAGMVSAFLFGVSAALVASPCTSPLLGGVLALMATTATYGQGLFLMTMYAVGFALLFIVLGFGAVSLRKLPKAGVWMTRLHKISSFILILAGIYYLSGLLN